jgi:hypothetical protein
MSCALKKGEKRKYTDDPELLFYVYDAKRQHLWSNFTAPLIEYENCEFKRFFRTGKVKKLFDICLRFVAIHVECVESFHRFPSLIAKQIFSECVTVGRFDLAKAMANGDESTVNSILELFALAYPDELATSLNFKNDYRLFKALSQSINCFRLRQIDLSNCDLNANGSGINLIDTFGKSMDSLEVLNLSDNSLDNGFIAKFTLPQRLDLNGFTRLVSIDLSANRKLTTACLNYFIKFPMLNEIILSYKDDKLPMRCDTGTKFKLCKCTNYSSDFQHVVENTGWIKSVIEQNNPTQSSQAGSVLSDLFFLSFFLFSTFYLFEEPLISNPLKSTKSTSSFYQYTKAHDDNNSRHETSYTNVRFRYQCKCIQYCAESNPCKSAGNQCKVKAKSTTTSTMLKISMDEFKALYM